MKGHIETLNRSIGRLGKEWSESTLTNRLEDDARYSRTTQAGVEAVGKVKIHKFFESSNLEPIDIVSSKSPKFWTNC